MVLPTDDTIAAHIARLAELARPRLTFLAEKPENWWLERVPFFDVERPRIWIFWRRVLHTAHHRTQLSVYLRLLGRPVPPTYGPTADVTWDDVPLFTRSMVVSSAVLLLAVPVLLAGLALLYLQHHSAGRAFDDTHGGDPLVSLAR